jgi:hypothetical protein
VKGPKDKKRLIDPSSAAQMFGRAGRPQFDTEGHVYVLAHEDDVKLAKWKVKYDSIPEDTKDPKLMSAKKALMKKKPARRTNVTYWNPEQFDKLQAAPPARLASKGRLTWRWLAYLLDANPAVEPIREVIRQRLMDQPTVEAELKRLTKMLVTLGHLGIVKLEPAPPASWQRAVKPETIVTASTTDALEEESDETPTEPATAHELIGRLTIGEHVGRGATSAPSADRVTKVTLPAVEPYDPVTAAPTGKLRELMVFRAVHPLYGLFLMDYLAQADDAELVQVLESLLEIPGSVARSVRVPWPDELPPGKLTTEVIDPAILTRGLAAQDDLYPPADQSDLPPELRKYPIPLAEKVRMLFENEVDHAGGLFVTPVWAVGDFLARGDGNFDAWVRARDLVKQEGILFKHLLRMILLCNEFAQLTPRDVMPADWQARLKGMADVLTSACRAVDPQSTDEMLEELLDDAPAATHAR